MNFVRRRQRIWRQHRRLCFGLLGATVGIVGMIFVQSTRAVQPQRSVHKLEAWFVLEPESGTFTADDAIALRMSLQDERGRTKDLTAQTDFEKNGDEAGTLIDGVYQPAMVGQTTIIGSIFGQRLEVRYDIEHGHAVSLSIDPVVASLKIGETQTFTLMAMDSDGNVFDVTSDAIWVASGGGTWLGNAFTAEAEGTFLVEATAHGLQATAELNITDPQPQESDVPTPPNDEPENPPDAPPVDNAPPPSDSSEPPQAPVGNEISPTPPEAPMVPDPNSTPNDSTNLPPVSTVTNDPPTTSRDQELKKHRSSTKKLIKRINETKKQLKKISLTKVLTPRIVPAVALEPSVQVAETTRSSTPFSELQQQNSPIVSGVSDRGTDPTKLALTNEETDAPEILGERTDSFGSSGKVSNGTPTKTILWIGGVVSISLGGLWSMIRWVRA